MSDDTEITPALTAEQWKEFPTVYFRPRREYTPGRFDEGYGAQLVDTGELSVWDDSWGLCVQPKDRHALAALALHGQPFGFTREDVRVLREIATDKRTRAAQYAAEGPTWATDPVNSIMRAQADWFDSLAARIAALLPPETP